MPPSSLEDRVRLLCERAVSAKTQAELDAILPELKAAIRDHISYVRAVVAETIPEAFGGRIHTVEALGIVAPLLSDEGDPIADSTPS